MLFFSFTSQPSAVIGFIAFLIINSIQIVNEEKTKSSDYYRVFTERIFVFLARYFSYLFSFLFFCSSRLIDKYR